MRRFKPALELLEERRQPSAGDARALHIVVEPGQSIQAAVTAARPGSVIVIEPGTYAQAVHVARPDLTLVGGAGAPVVLANPGSLQNGVTVTGAAARFTLENIAVQGFRSNGVLLQGVHGFHIRHVSASNDGDYGIFPVFCTHGLIEDCRASGHDDTGVYIGQSTDVTIRACVAFDNVNGFEVENSSQVRVLDNKAYGNTAGVLIDLLPQLPVKTATAIVAAGNFVHDNNRPNTANPKDIASAVPAGTGFLILGTRRTSLFRNTVVHNDFCGIALASTQLLTSFAGLPARDLAGIDPNPRDVSIHNNDVVHNGTHAPNALLPAADLLWDGSGKDNRWQANVFATSIPRRLPGTTASRA
jgi:parallel beta-helix repeat protein